MLPVASTELGELVLGAGQADAEPFDFAEPAFTSGLGNAGDEVVADLLQSEALGRVRPQERTSDTCMLMNTRSGVEKARSQVPMDTLRFSK